ncbi:MAG: alpha/beta hydrolase [Burkholderiaceae bacterium]
MQASTTTIDGISVHIEGEGPDTLVFLHGWPDTLRLWDCTVSALRARYRCVRFTLPGFDLDLPARGMTLGQMTALLARIVDDVSPGKSVTLVLHDWGCAFGYEFAAQHPQRVARIVAVDVGDHNSDALHAALTAKARAQVFVYQFWLAIAWFVRGSIGDRMTRGMARALRCRTDPARITWQMNYPYAMKWFGVLGGWSRARRVDPQCPTLYTYGERKLFMFHSRQWLERLAARPGSKVQGFATGHWVMVQQPDAFNACLLEWLDSTAPAS